MIQMLLALLLWPEVTGHSYDVIPGIAPHNILDPSQFGAKVQDMMADMPEWKRAMLKYLPPAPKDLHMDPRVEALHPSNDIQEAVRKASESFFGEKLEEEPIINKAVKFDEPKSESPDTDAPPVKPVTAQNEDDEEDNMIWIAVGGVAVGAAVVWLISTKSRNPVVLSGAAPSSNAGYAKLPEKRSRGGGLSDSDGSSGADHGSTGSHSNTAPNADIYSSIRRSLQDSDPSTVWKSVRASFVNSDGGSHPGSATSPAHPEAGRKQRDVSHTADTSSVSHTDSEEEITEVYDRVKKSLKNLNLLPRKSQEMTKDMLPQGPGGSSGSNR